MACYRFFPAANARQDQIWRYTVETRGEARAEKYIRELHHHLQHLADSALYWHRIPRRLAVPIDLAVEVFFSRDKKHYIFFRELSDGIGIMSILHESMDLPTRLKEDLQRLQKNDQAQ